MRLFKRWVKTKYTNFWRRTLRNGSPPRKYQRYWEYPGVQCSALWIKYGVQRIILLRRRLQIILIDFTVIAMILSVLKEDKKYGEILEVKNVRWKNTTFKRGSGWVTARFSTDLCFHNRDPVIIDLFDFVYGHLSKIVGWIECGSHYTVFIINMWTFNHAPLLDYKTQVILWCALAI